MYDWYNSSIMTQVAVQLTTCMSTSGMMDRDPFGSIAEYFLFRVFGIFENWKKNNPFNYYQCRIKNNN